MKVLLTGLLLAAGAMGASAAQDVTIDLRDWQQSEQRSGAERSTSRSGGSGADDAASRAGEVDRAEQRRDSERLRGPGAPAPAGSGDGSDHRDATGTSEGSSPYDVPGSPRATDNN